MLNQRSILTWNRVKSKWLVTKFTTLFLLTPSLNSVFDVKVWLWNLREPSFKALVCSLRARQYLPAVSNRNKGNNIDNNLRPQNCCCSRLNNGHIYLEDNVKMLIQCYHGQVPVPEDGPQPVHPESERGGHHDRLHAPHLPRQPLLRGARHRGAGGTGIPHNHLVICVHACIACPWCSDLKFEFHFLTIPW